MLLYSIVWRWAAALSWAVILTLSLRSRRAGIRDTSNVTYALVYGVSGLVTRLAFLHVESRWQVVGFCFAAALIEACGAGKAGDATRLTRWSSCAAGAAVGVAIMHVYAHARNL